MDLNFVINVPAHVIAPKNAMLSTDTVPCQWLGMIYVDLMMSYEMADEISRNLLALHVFTFLAVLITITIYILLYEF